MNCILNKQIERGNVSDTKYDIKCSNCEHMGTSGPHFKCTMKIKTGWLGKGDTDKIISCPAFSPSADYMLGLIKAQDSTKELSDCSVPVVNTIQFPIVFKRCPLCGCEDTVLARYKKENKLNAVIATFRLLVPLADMTQVVSPQIPAIELLKDVCAGCGHEYVTIINKISIRAQFNVKGMSGPLSGS